MSGDKSETTDFEYHELVLTQTPPGTNENAANTTDHTVLQVPANEEVHQPVLAYQPVPAYQPVTHIDRHQSTMAVGTFPAYLQAHEGYAVHTQKLHCAAAVITFLFLVLTCGLGLPLTIPTFLCLYMGSNASNLKKRKVFIKLAFITAVSMPLLLIILIFLFLLTVPVKVESTSD